MLIQKKRIRVINNVHGASTGEMIVVALRSLERLYDHLRRAGFSKDVNVGEVILPTAIGSISTFNAEGKYDIHKDQPKETVYRLGEWKWHQFNGPYDTIERSKIVEIPYSRYPRTFIEPPSVELYIALDEKGEKVLRSQALQFTDANHNKLVHTINLFLEHFGECELLRENLTPILPAKLIRLNWHILPQGRMPWTQLRHHLKPLVDRQPEGNRAVIDKRHEAVSTYGPEFVAVGQGGFDGYVIFGFPEKKLFILESTQINNATYVLDSNWEELSCLTKAQLLNNNLHKDRIVHRESWFSQMNQLLNSSGD